MNDEENKEITNKAKVEDELYASDLKAAFLTRTSPFAKGILYTVIILLIVFIIWAYFGNLEQVTIGEAKVIPSSQVKAIQSLDGGIVTEIPVKEGEMVKKGQMLIKLDDTRYAAEYHEGYAKYIALQAMIARLNAEAYNEPITFPENVIKDAPELVKRETRFYQTRQKNLQEEIAVLQHDKKLSIRILNMYNPLVKKGIVSQVDYLKARQRVNEIQTSILEKQDKFHEDVWNDLNNKKADLSTLGERLKSLKDKMIRSTLYSPVNGVVKKINVYTIGGTISPGMIIMEVVPLEDTLLVEAKIVPRDIAFVELKQDAIVRIMAYDYTVYGDLPGKVEYISPDAIEEPKTGNQPPVSYYLVDVRTQKNYLGDDKHKLPIIPGMTATVHIITGHKTVLEYLLKPLIKVKKEALRER